MRETYITLPVQSSSNPSSSDWSIKYGLAPGILFWMNALEQCSRNLFLRTQFLLLCLLSNGHNQQDVVQQAECVVFTVAWRICTFNPTHLTSASKYCQIHYLSRMTNTLKILSNLPCLQIKPSTVVVCQL